MDKNYGNEQIMAVIDEMLWGDVEAAQQYLDASPSNREVRLHQEVAIGGKEYKHIEYSPEYAIQVRDDHKNLDIYNPGRYTKKFIAEAAAIVFMAFVLIAKTKLVM